MSSLSLTLIFCLALASLSVANAKYPLYLVRSGRPYCVRVDAPEETLLRIHYEAPDLKQDQVNKKKGDEDHAPTYITINYNSHVVGSPKPGASQKYKPSNTELKKTTGYIDYDVAPREGDDDWQEDVGQLQICIRAAAASQKNAMRFGIHVEEAGTESVDGSQIDIKGHLSSLEIQMLHYHEKMRFVMKEFQAMKGKDAFYHKKTDEMYDATTFWPMLHVAILLLTGFTQANHIVQFFKSKRII